jgi:hypothetical protein
LSSNPSTIEKEREREREILVDFKHNITKIANAFLGYRNLSYRPKLRQL